MGAEMYIQSNHGDYNKVDLKQYLQQEQEERPSETLFIVSNRLPFSLAQRDDGSFVGKQSAGGLVTAMEPLLAQSVSRGVWIGWSGRYVGNDFEREGISEALRSATSTKEYDVVPVELSAEQIRGYYDNISNDSLWWMHHHTKAENFSFDPDSWQTYLEVNAVFAQNIIDNTPEGANVWVQDYHLTQVVEQMPAEERKKRNLGWYCHIPSPTPESMKHAIDQGFPAEDYLRGLLKYNLLGFQSQPDVDNFAACVQTYLGEQVTIKDNEDGSVMFEFDIDGDIHRVSAKSFPISVDAKEFTSQAHNPRVKHNASRIRTAVGKDTHLTLNVGRNDPGKGLYQRVEAVNYALEKDPHLRDKLTHIEVAVPNRPGNAIYRQYAQDLRQTVSQVNTIWERKGHRRPVRLIERNLPRQILLGHYGAADAVLATTEIDGQMLIPYEALLSGREDIYVALGKGAGASHILKDYTTLVDGADPHDVAYAIIESHRMSSAAKIARVVAAREYIAQNDVQTWARNYYTEFKKTAR